MDDAQLIDSPRELPALCPVRRPPEASGDVPRRERRYLRRVAFAQPNRRIASGSGRSTVGLATANDPPPIRCSCVRKQRLSLNRGRFAEFIDAIQDF